MGAGDLSMNLSEVIIIIETDWNGLLALSIFHINNNSEGRGVQWGMERTMCTGDRYGGGRGVQGGMERSLQRKPASIP